jgi:PGM1 C-terminal domain
MSSRPPLSAEDLAAFQALQRTLVGQWKTIASRSREEQSIVVVPSLSMEVDMPAATQQAYEERFLFLMLLLRLPRARVVYVTSQPILPEVIDYYLGLLAGVIPSHARARLFTLAALDGSPRPLTLKLLERPRLIARIRGLIPNPATCHLVPFNATEQEQELALRLGIPMYAADARFAPLGSKTGCRRMFAEEGVPHPLGVEDLHSLDDVSAALVRIRSQRPEMRQALVKLNDGVSGLGNALVDLEGLPAPGAAAEGHAVADRVRQMRLEAQGRTLEDYLDALAKDGGVVEERISGDEFRSPSVQLRITPVGGVQILSTHDQLLGGPGGMSFLGALFPADEGYAVAITREARKVGARLAREGVWGRSAVDFVTVRSAGGPWRVYAIELNLRKGGTTAPYLTLEFLTQGHYDADTACFRAPDGGAKYYIASDHAESPAYRVLQPLDLFDVAVRHELHFSAATQTGVVFHMLAALSERGFFGFTAVGDSRAQARELYDRTLATVAAEAGLAAS